MRLPLRHPPPHSDANPARCEYLVELAEAACGLPLVAAAGGVAARGGRGRHGAALQWHFGLAPHDGEASPDWEGRIEIKLVSVWRRPGAPQDELVCDKLKVCDAGVDPWRKLETTLWVFADRLSRVVLGYRFTALRGSFRQRLAASWNLDPHFGHPDLFVEPRISGESRAPAYYLSSAFMVDHVVDTRLKPLAYSQKWWSTRRDVIGQTPGFTVLHGAGGPQICAHCGGEVDVDYKRVEQWGWAAARHRDAALDARCRGQLMIDSTRLPRSRICSFDEWRALLEAAGDDQSQLRLVDRVIEPEDHAH